MFGPRGCSCSLQYAIFFVAFFPSLSGGGGGGEREKGTLGYFVPPPPLLEAIGFQSIKFKR